MPIYTFPANADGGGDPVAVDNHVATAQSLYAEATLPDQVPVNPPMIYNGVAVASIPVPSGKLIITDAFFGFGFVFWTIEVDFGAGFVPVANFGFTLLTPITTEVKRFKSPIVIQGGPGVAVRLKVAAATPPSAPLDVNATLRMYTAA